MVRPNDLSDAQKTAFVRRAQAPLKRIVWFGFGLLATEGIVLGVYTSLPNAHLTETQMLVVAVVTVLVVGGFTTLAKRTSAALRTRDVLRLGREDFDKNYRKFLFRAPIFLALTSIGAGFRLMSWQMGAVTKLSSQIALWVLAVGVLSQWFLSFTIFAGNGRKDIEDEMTTAHRSQAYGAGFVTAALTGLALAVLMIFAPRIGSAAAPALLTLPLMIAMVRLGLLERAAALDD